MGAVRANSAGGIDATPLLGAASWRHGYPSPVPAVADEAVVLRVWEFSETSQTVSLFTRERGLIRGLVKGAFRPASKFGGGLEPLTRGQVLFIAKPTGELATVTEWDLHEVFWGPRHHLTGHRAGLYIADLVHHSILDHDPHPGLFASLVEALRALDSPDEAPRTLLRFQWRLLVEIGYQPRIELNHAPNGRAPLLFSPAAGGLIDPQTADSSGWRVRPQTIHALRALARENPDPTSPAAAPTTDIDRAGHLLSEYLRHLLGRDLSSRDAVYGPPQSPPARSEKI
jgi:DNA repair protein RecO (recombination protein O)